MSIGILPSANDAEIDCLARIAALLPVLSYSQLLALKSKVDGATASIPSGFLRLPPEIRLTIYKNYFDHIDEVIRIERVIDESGFADDESSAVAGMQDCTNILVVCRLITAEARPLLRRAIESRRMRFCMAERRVRLHTGKFLTSAHSMLTNIGMVEVPLGVGSAARNTSVKALQGRKLNILCPRILVSTSDRDGSAVSLEHAAFSRHIGRSCSIDQPEPLSNWTSTMSVNRDVNKRLHSALVVYGNHKFTRLNVSIPLQSQGGCASYDTVSHT